MAVLVFMTNAYAKKGDNNNQNNQQGGPAESCDINNTLHKRQDLFPFVKITCELKEFLYLPSKGNHCGINSTARTVWFSNCTVPEQTHPSQDHSLIRDGFAVSTYFPGGCFSDEQHVKFDAIGFDKLPIGTHVELILGQFGGVQGYGPGSFIYDVHQVTIAGRTSCISDHGIENNQNVRIGTILIVTPSDRSWLRETN